jgi:hypothetical protein
MTRLETSTIASGTAATRAFAFWNNATALNKLALWLAPCELKYAIPAQTMADIAETQAGTPLGARAGGLLVTLGIYEAGQRRDQGEHA